MLEIITIINNKKFVIESLKKRGIENADKIIEKIISLDKERKCSQQKYDENNSLAKNFSNKIEKIIKENGSKGDLQNLKENVARCKKNIVQYKGVLNQYSNEIKNLLSILPNIPHSTVPLGNSLSDNEIIHEKKFHINYTQNLLPHWDLVKKYNLIDFDCGIKVTGAGFPIYLGKFAKLQRALINFLLDEAEKEGYREVQVPIIVNEESAYGTGQLPDMEKQMYEIANENMYLIPTSETPITNIYRKHVFLEKELPLKLVSYTPCFRREAGSWGADVRGLNRLHQFDKVELVIITKPENSYREMEAIACFLKRVLEKLNITYRILKLCIGEMGGKAAMQYDFEAWTEGQKKWVEISSLSNFETYQANRMAMRYKNSEGEKFLTHTLNASCFGIPRLMIALIENFQQGNTIKVPQVLQPYTHFEDLF